MRKHLFFLLPLFLLSALLPGQEQERFQDSIRQLLVKTSDPLSRLDLLKLLSGSYVYLYNDSAAYYAQQAWELALQLDDKREQVECASLLCFSLTLYGNYPAALDFGLRSLGLAEELRDSSLLMKVHSNLMISYGLQQDYQEALKHGHRTISYSQSQNVGSGYRGVQYGLKGNIFYEMDQPDSALYYHLISFGMGKQWSGIYLALGKDYVKRQQYDSALFYLRAGIPVAIRNRVYIDLAGSYNEMSKVFESTGNLDSSVYYAQQSILQKGIRSFPEWELRAYNQLAHVYDRAGVKDSTIKYLKMAADLKEKLFDREKTREAQSMIFNEQLHRKDIEAQQQQAKNRSRVTILALSIIAVLLIAVILYRNNRIKQRTNKTLENTLNDLKTTQSQLIQSEKMASLGELTAGIAHEIQNPLNFVNNFSEVSHELIDEMNTELDKGEISDAKLISADLKQNLEKIIHHGKRADAIVKGMLQHSRISSGQKEPTDINALCDEYLRLSYHGLRAKDKTFNAEIKTEFDNNIGKIDIVPEDIGRVVLNLINNAFYAVSEKAKQNVQGYEPNVTVSTKKLNGKVEISVKDNGNGIPDSIKEKIFQPFFTTKPTGQGTGLGLSLSYDIVKAHSAKIEVESHPGEGTVFTIIILSKG